MTTYLVSRHAGAVEWMNFIGHHYDYHLHHLSDYKKLERGDVVIGSLPINIVAELNKRGIAYFHLSIDIPESLRGVELSAHLLSFLDARLERYEVHCFNC